MSVEELLLNDSFVNYCMWQNEEDIIFWERWKAANPVRERNVAEAQVLFHLLNGGHSAENLHKDLAFFTEAFEKHRSTGDSEAEMRELACEEDLNIEDLNVGARPTLKKAWVWTASIAVGLIVIFLVYMGDFRAAKTMPIASENKLQKSLPAERKSFQLPDGSTVMLNSGSTLEILDGFNTHTREVKLNGEAFFDVTHNANVPFVIHTSSMKVKVLGTVFNIKAFPGETLSETTLIKGSVEVTLLNKSGKKVILHPNQKIIVPNRPVGELVSEKALAILKGGDYMIKGLSYREADSSMVETEWTDNKLAFDDKSLEEIASQLERWYDVKITIENDAVKLLHFSGMFHQKTLTQVLNYLQLTSRSFQYKITEDRRVIISK